MKLQFFSDYSIIIRSMKKVKHILATFLHSFIPQDIYYPKLLHTRFQFSLKYYLVLMSFFTLIFTGVVFCRFSPLKMIGYKNSIINSFSTFPGEVIIKINKGMLESNQNKPLFLWIYHNNQPLFVFMVHTKDMLDSSHIPLPLIFLGQNKMQISYRGNVIVRPYNPSWNILITKERIQSFIGFINSFFPPFIFFFYILLIVVVPVMFMMGSTFFILLSSMVVFLLLRTFIPHIHLKKCIQASIHGTHIPLIIVIFLFILFPSATNIVVITASLIFVFTLVSTYEMYSKEISHVAHSKCR